MCLEANVPYIVDGCETNLKGAKGNLGDRVPLRAVSVTLWWLAFKFRVEVQVCEKLELKSTQSCFQK
jgi:hypothetical protein